MFKNKLFILIAVTLLIASFSYAQKTSGELHGTVVTTGNAPVPGVKVTITSPKLMGQKVAVTDEDGSFKFGALVPGFYAVKAELKGFKTTIQENVNVSLAGTTTIKMDMEIGTITEMIRVTASEAAVDITSSSVSTNVKKEFFEALPKGRDFESMVMMAPSTVEGRNGISFSGATGLENLFVVDGINVTDVEHGDGSTNVVYEYIDEVEVKTSGYAAEFGGALGGVVNIITKSGGNEFHGSAMFNYRSDKLEAERRIGYSGINDIKTYNYFDFGLGVGGYLVKDKLWFFAATTPSFRKRTYEQVNDYTKLMVSGETDEKQYYFSGKLTFKLAENHNMTFSVFGDPRKEEGGNPGTLTDPNSDYEYSDTGGTYNFVGKYEGLFGNSWMVNVLVGRYWDHTRLLPLSGNMDNPMLIYYYGAGGRPQSYTEGGFGWYSDPADKWRWTVTADVTKYIGDHTVKIGVNFFRAISDRYDNYTGKYYRVIYPQRYQDNYGWKYIDRTRTTVGNAYTDIMALYVQDSFKIGRLQLNLGVRFERQAIHATDTSQFFKPHEAVIDWGFDDQIAPRVGFTYDIFGDMTTKIFGSYARYFEMVPLNMNCRTFGYELDQRDYYSDTGVYHHTKSYGHAPPPIQPGIKAPYQEEYILGIERQLSKDVSISIRGVYKNLGRYFEDLSFDGGSSYFIANPGEWIPEGFVYENDLPQDMLDRCPEEYWYFPKPYRWYKALEVVLRKAYSNNYQFMLSYTYGRAKGNTMGFAFEEYQNQNDPNITGLYDFPELMYNVDGFLTNDRKHQLKFDGSYTFDFGLSMGMSLRYYGGKPYTWVGHNEWYGWMVLLEQRGTSGRLPNVFTIDIHGEYSFNMGKNVKLTIFCDLFNITNFNKETRIQTRYDGTDEYGFSDADYTIYPPWTLPATATYEQSGDALVYYLPFRALIGVKIGF